MLHITIVREMQIRTTMRYHLAPFRMAIIETFTNNKCGDGVEKREPSYAVGGNINWEQPLQWTVWKFLKKLKIELAYDPAIPLLGVYLEKTRIRKDPGTPTFTAPLFTTAKTWKPPQCPSTDKQKRKMWYVYTMEYYSAIKKEWNDAVGSNMDGPRDDHT